MDVDTHFSSTIVPQDMSWHFSIEPDSAIAALYFRDHENCILYVYFQIRHVFTSSSQTLLVM